MAAIKQQTKAKILTIAIPLYAKAGFDRVSMRQIAAAVGIKAASLYHHFPDKQTLYIEALSFAIEQRADLLSEAFTLATAPEERLRVLIHKLCMLMADDVNFGHLLQREIMHGDAQRLRFLADHVFTEFCAGMTELCATLAPDRDPQLLAISVLSLVMYHYQLTPLRSFLPDFKESHNDPETISNHIFSLLMDGLPARYSWPDKTI